MKVKDVGEFGLIENIAEIVEQADERVVVTIGDDTAVVRPQKHGLTLLTTDLLVENVHFTLESISPRQLGYKSLAVNISDIAAMGGLPTYAVISLALNPETDLETIEDIYRGMMDISREYRLSIVGGDITKSERLVINVALMGEVEEENLCRRSDAVVGDIIMVTGMLGASAAGLRLALNPHIEPEVKEASLLKRAHFLPEPRVKEGRILATSGVHAMEDISDGLASEINHICAASEVGAQIDFSKIPIAKGVDSVAAQTGERAIDLALSGGEDYELVFTTPSALIDGIEKKLSSIGCRAHIVGEIVRADMGISAIDWSGAKHALTDLLAKSGYSHF
jgi:thiamine-monophosphate kinase